MMQCVCVCVPSELTPFSHRDTLSVHPINRPLLVQTDHCTLLIEHSLYVDCRSLIWLCLGLTIHQILLLRRVLQILELLLLLLEGELVRAFYSVICYDVQLTAFNYVHFSTNVTFTANIITGTEYLQNATFVCVCVYY